MRCNAVPVFALLGATSDVSVQPCTPQRIHIADASLRVEDFETDFRVQHWKQRIINGRLTPFNDLFNGVNNKSLKKTKLRELHHSTAPQAQPHLVAAVPCLHPIASHWFHPLAVQQEPGQFWQRQQFDLQNPPCLRIFTHLPTPICQALCILLYGYGSIPINTIFSGMNIHKSQLFWCELQGYYWFWHTAVCLCWFTG